MIKDIKFKKFDTGKSEIDCADGEIAINYGSLANDDGTYGCGLAAKTEITVPQGYRVLALHKVEPYQQVILLSNADGSLSLHHAAFAPEIKEAHIRDIGEIKGLRGIEIMGHRVEIATDDGLVHLIWDAGYRSAVAPTRAAGYRLIPAALPQLDIEFGLQKAGELVCTDVIHTTVTAMTNATAPYAPGSGASRPHPLATSDKEEKDNLSESIMKIYTNALHQQVDSKGYFHQPMLVRYALRLSDGSYIMPSAPVLLTPTVLPPRIVITSHTAGEDKATVSVDLSHNRFFQLRYRIPLALPRHLQGIVAAIDVFATAPIPTYDDSWGDGCITSFQSVTDASDNALPPRGRTPSRTSASDIFEGHYSEGGDTYIDHMLDEAVGNHQIWYVAPNRHLADDIVGAHTYYRIASIPYDTLEGVSQFQPLPLLTSDLGGILSHPILHDDQPQRDILPSALARHASRLIIGARSYRLAVPASLRASAAFSGSAADASAPATVSVYAISDGKMYRTSSECTAYASPLTEHFPRYLYYPDPKACIMTLRQNDNLWVLPLTRHDHLPGAYWWGGLDKDFAPEPRAFVDSEEELSDIVAHEAKVYVSAVENPFKIASSADIGAGEIHAIATARQAPKGGTYGTYPFYAIGSAGVWMLRFADSKGEVTAVRQISDVGCTSSCAAVETGDTVTYAGKGGVYEIKGSEVTEISKELRHLKFDIEILPYAKDLLQLAKAMKAEVESQEFFSTCVMSYMPDHKLLIVSGNDGVNFAYHTELHTWSLTDVVLRGNVAGARHLAIGANGEAVSLTSDTDARQAMLVTRALKFCDTVAGQNVRSVEVIGDFREGAVMTAHYGANHLGCWHLIGSRKGCVLHDANGSKYRYHRIVVISRLLPDEYVYGLQVSVQ